MIGPDPEQLAEDYWSRDEQFICSKDNPWSSLEKAKRTQHPDAVEVDSTLCDCCAYYKCPNCGLRFRNELPQ